jgi:Spy/CpxP family protein refolding chaperone
MRACRTLMALLVAGAALGHRAATAAAQPASHVLSAEDKGSFSY